MVRIAVFASGSGTNAENLVKYFREFSRHKAYNIEVVCIVTNKKDAFVLERAKKLGVEGVFFSKDDFENTSKVLDYLRDKRVNFIVLAGFLIKVPENIIRWYAWRGDRILNIHPALLPKYGGKGMYGDRVHKAVVEAREKETGITIHCVNENYDEGMIIFQEKCPVDPEDTYEDVAQKVHELEYRYYPIVIVNYLDDKCMI